MLLVLADLFDKKLIKLIELSLLKGIATLMLDERVLDEFALCLIHELSHLL